MQTENITCINCPIGCRITVELEDGVVKTVTGNTCKRGENYARQECVKPMRMVTAVMPVEGSEAPLSVKTKEPIPKAQIMECMHKIDSAVLHAPIKAGDVVIPDVVGTGVPVIATKSV